MKYWRGIAYCWSHLASWVVWDQDLHAQDSTCSSNANIMQMSVLNLNLSTNMSPGCILFLYWIAILYYIYIKSSYLNLPYASIRYIVWFVTMYYVVYSQSLPGTSYSFIRMNPCRQLCQVVSPWQRSSSASPVTSKTGIGFFTHIAVSMLCLVPYLKTQCLVSDMKQKHTQVIILVGWISIGLGL